MQIGNLEMQPVSRDGELILYASKDRQYGVLFNSVNDTRSGVLPLQVFFKWGNFEPIEEPPANA